MLAAALAGLAGTLAQPVSARAASLRAPQPAPLNTAATAAQPASAGGAAGPDTRAPGWQQTSAGSSPSAPSTGSGPARTEPQGAAGDAARPVLLVLGDSLSAGYGLSQEQGWVSLLARRLAEDSSDLRRPDWQVVNASISGETTAGGRSRLPALLAQHRPALVLIELGGNDALRGLPLASARANLQQMIRDAHASGAHTLLVGMQIPPNYGRSYARQFEQMFQQLARDNGSALVPFLLDGFGEDRHWFQPDGIHPTADAQPKMLDNVWPVLRPLLVP